jgi:non-ribosomal peptide synthetase component E (peptide arylation enzyme)
LEGAFRHRRGITNNARQRTAETICPRETEELLYAHDNVADVAVVGLADALFG